MRIVHVIASMAQEMGGPPRVVARLAVAQRNEGHRVTVATQWPQNPTTILGDLGIPDSAGSDVEVCLLPAGGTFGLSRRRIGSSLFNDVVGGADVVHVHGAWEPTIHMALRLAVRSHKVAAITPHGMISDYGMRQRRFKKALAMAVYVRRSIEIANVVHALTDTERATILHYAPLARVQVIPNGIALDEFANPPDMSALLTSNQALATTRYVLFLARLDPMKGLDILVRSFVRVIEAAPDLRLVIAGPDYGAGKPAQQLARQLGVDDRVDFVGPVYGEVKRALLAGAICFAQPSRHEGFSLSLLEALASGTPVVASDRVDVPGLTERGVGRLVALDPKAVAEAILYYASNPMVRQEVGAKAKQLVRDRYTWGRIAGELLKTYDDCRGPRLE